MPADVEFIRGLYGDAARVWTSEVLDHMRDHAWDPDIDWRAIEGAPDDVGVMHGRDRLRRYYAEWEEMFDELTMDAREIFAVGDRVVAVVHVTARSRSADVPTELDYCIVYDVRDGRVVSGREYHTREEAVAAAEATGEMSGSPAQ
jgi:ketosteroid isomerase-like protein